MSQRVSERVSLRPLTVVPDGDDVLVGDPERGVYVAVPPIGGVVVRALLDGRTLTETTELAERESGQPVDVAAFVTTLAELGFVHDTGDADDATVTPERTAPVQQRGWLAGPSARMVRPLFGRVAWTVYGLAAAFCVLVFALRPDLFPTAADAMVLPDVGLSLVVLVPLAYLLGAVHELWHFLAARALGLHARFGVDRRLYFLVFETDLSQLWSLPRRARYGPQLAGLAINVVFLAVFLAVELLWPSQWLMPGLIFATVTTTLWQCMIFLRTDLYGVFLTATGCRDLWRVKTLLLRRAFGRLDPAGAAELAAAGERDIRVGTWFRWLWLVGCAIALGYFAVFYLPLLSTMAGWTVEGVATGAGGRFWWTLLGSVLLYLPLVTVGLLAVRERLIRRQTRPAT
jgi:putative peptide zinc metalloprotease protein